MHFVPACCCSRRADRPYGSYRAVHHGLTRTDQSAMDLVAALDADLPAGVDALADAKVQALQALHQQKIKILMKSINGLKEEIAALKVGRQAMLLNRSCLVVAAQPQDLPPAPPDRPTHPHGFLC